MGSKRVGVYVWISSVYSEVYDVEVLWKNKGVYVAFTDLEKAYDELDIKPIWQVLQMCARKGSDEFLLEE